MRIVENVASVRRDIQAARRTTIALARCESGQAIPEYALVTALFGLAAMAALVAVGSAASTQLADTQNRVQTDAVALPTP